MIMKTLRFIGMAIVAIIMSVNFAACSDDDEDIDISQLEGTWGLVRSVGWELCHEDGARDDWDYTCDPYNPDSGDGECEKLVIKKLTDNTYSVAAYYYNGSEWRADGGSQTLTLNGNTLTVSKTNGNYGYFDSYANLIIEALTTEKLAIRVKYDNVQTDPEHDPDHRDSADFTETFTKME
jgi:hypothetical protein